MRRVTSIASHVGHLFSLLAVLVSLGCAEQDDFRDCSSTGISFVQTLPTLLSETGLYSDVDGEVLDEGVVPFTPRYELWTDGASKRRWLKLPQGKKVDTSDPDKWSFPVGTKLFKEFSRDGVRIETRLSVRDEDGWSAISYVWTDDQADAELDDSGLSDAKGTEHDVPTAAQCFACHGGRDNFVLGFAAIQFDEATRGQYFDDGILSQSVEGEPSVPPAIAEGLGVLHANCSHCHNADRSTAPQGTACFDPDNELDFTFPVRLGDVNESPLAQTAADSLESSDRSPILRRMSERNTSLDRPSMPPLGTEVVDDEGLAAVTELVEQLSAQ